MLNVCGGSALRTGEFDEGDLTCAFEFLVFTVEREYLFQFFHVVLFSSQSLSQTLLSHLNWLFCF